MGVKASASGSEGATFVVRFPPIWSHLSPLVEYVRSLLEVRGRTEGSDRVAIVVHELLENAVKYGDPACEVKLEVFLDAGAIDIRVTNKAHPSRITILERELRRNRSTPPQEAFARALERLQHLPEGSTMLGLARVALEAKLDVQTTGGVVVSTAQIDTVFTRSSLNANKSPLAGSNNAEAAPFESRSAEANASSASQTRRAVEPGGSAGAMRDADKASIQRTGVEPPRTVSTTRRIDGAPVRSGDSNQSLRVASAAEKPRGPSRR